jgi:hypothetical protein
LTSPFDLLVAEPLVTLPDSTLVAEDELDEEDEEEEVFRDTKGLVIGT